MASALRRGQLRKTRKELKLTQDELAQLARVERTKISRVENGFVTFTAEEAAAIERALLGVMKRRTARLEVLLGAGVELPA